MIEIKKYPYSINSFNIGEFGTLQFAQWLHPLYKKVEFNEHLVRNYSKIIKKGSVVIDIGAHTGDTAVIYSKCAGDKGAVVSFEPNTMVYEILKVNSEISFPDIIIPVNYAIVDDNIEGVITKTFHYTDQGLCNGGFSTSIEAGAGGCFTMFPCRVECVNFNKWMKKNHPALLDNISFIKIDTEGFDKNILKSLSEVISKNNPIMQIERFPHLSDLETGQLYDAIDELNYKSYDFSGYDIDKITSTALSREEFISMPKSILEILCLPK